jgi:23S rRNA pseudouridine2605 synthase
MPPRHTYWTIILEGKPTAFRAHTEEELLPTLKQLQARHPDAVMRWFARGKLWHSQEEERLARAARDATREKRGRDWRPGGMHRDPRERFDIPRDERRRRFRDRLFRDRQESGGGKPREDVPGSNQDTPRKPQHGEARPPARENRRPWRPQGDRPPRSGGDRPPRSGGDRPPRSGGDRPPRSDGDRPPRSGSDRPPRGPSDRGWKPQGPAGAGGGWKPKGPPREGGGGWRPKGPKGPQRDRGRGGNRSGGNRGGGGTRGGGGNRGGGNRGGGGRGGPR